MLKTIRIRKTNILALLLIILAMTGCGQEVIYEDYVTIPDNGWNKDSMATFRVKIDDVKNNYDIFINIRNKSDYPNSNIWLFVDVTSPEGKTIRDTLNYFLADEHGKWIGSGWGDMYLVQYPYRRNIKFAKAGEYRFSIIQGMRYDKLEGIHNIGITIAKSPQTDE